MVEVSDGPWPWLKSPGADGSAWSLRGSAKCITREPVGCGHLDAGKAGKDGMGTMFFWTVAMNMCWNKENLWKGKLWMMIPWFFADDSSVFWTVFLMTQGVAAVRYQLCPWASPTVPSWALLRQKRIEKWSLLIVNESKWFADNNS